MLMIAPWPLLANALMPFALMFFCSSGYIYISALGLFQICSVCSILAPIIKLLVDNQNLYLMLLYPFDIG